MSQWSELYFAFDGKSSRDFKLMMLDVNEDGEKVKFGLDRTIQEEENNIGNNPYFIRIKNNAVDITIELVKANENMIALPFNDEELDEIKKWLFKSTYKALVVEDKVYYVIFDKMGIKKEYGSTRTGYLTLNAHVRDGFAHSPIFIVNLIAKGEKTEVIKNLSNVDEVTYIDMDITQLSDTKEDIIIQNCTNGDMITIKGVEKNENIMVYSKDMEAYSLTNDTSKIFNNTTYNNHFISIRYGKNKLKCIGNFQVIFTYDVLMQM